MSLRSLLVGHGPNVIVDLDSYWLARVCGFGVLARGFIACVSFFIDSPES